MIKKLLGTAAMVAGMLGFAAPASAGSVYLTDWYLDADGTGSGAAVQVKNYLDIVGAAFVHNTFTSGSTFNFNEAGIFGVHTADGGAALGGAVLGTDLSATFVGTGTGTTGGALTFSTGALNIYGAGNVLIGTFQLVTGSAALSAGSTLPNGVVSLIFQATYLAQNYWFDSSHVDLYNQTDVTLGFATTNAIEITNQAGQYQTAGANLQNLYSSNFGPNATGYTGNGTTNLYISNNGQYQLAATVPEPASLALVGLGLVGAALARRRKSA